MHSLKRSLLVLSCGIILNTTPETSLAASAPSHGILVKPFIEAAGYGFSLKSLIGGGPEVKWNPNVRGLIGVDVSIDNLIGFSVANKTPLPEDERRLKGDTDYQDWRLSLAYPKFHIGLVYQVFQGFYLENSSAIDNSLTDTDPKIQAPEMKSQNFAADFTWVFSPNEFSFEAALDQTQRQTSSGWSGLAGMSASHTGFSDPTALVPQSVQSSFGEDQDITRASFYSLTARGGLGATLASSSGWFLSGMGLFGAGPQWGVFGNSTRENRRVDLVPRADLLLSTGYNGERFVGGFRGNVASNGYKTNSIEIPSTVFSFRVFIGSRF